MGSEGYAGVVDFAEFGQGEDLVSAAVSQDRAVPRHEAVKAAVMPDDVGSGSEGEVVSVGEEDPAAGFAELGRGDAADGAAGSDGHEGGEVDGAVGGGEGAEADLGGGITGSNFVVKHAAIVEGDVRTG